MRKTVLTGGLIGGLVVLSLASASFAQGGEMERRVAERVPQCAPPADTAEPAEPASADEALRARATGELCDELRTNPQFLSMLDEASFGRLVECNMEALGRLPEAGRQAMMENADATLAHQAGEADAGVGRALMGCFGRITGAD